METEVLKELDFKKIQDNLWIYIGDLYIITCSSIKYGALREELVEMIAFFRESELVFSYVFGVNDKSNYKYGFNVLLNKANKHIGEIIAKQIADI